MKYLLSLFILLTLVFGISVFSNAENAGGVDMWVNQLDAKQIAIFGGRLHNTGFFRQEYAGTSADCLYIDYTGSGNNILNLLADGAAVLTLDKTGFMAIGTDSPLGKLHIYTSDSTVSAASVTGDDLVIEEWSLERGDADE